MTTEPTPKKRGRPVTKGFKDPPRSLRVPDDEYDRWRAAAARRGISIARLIRQRMARVK